MGLIEYKGCEPGSAGARKAGMTNALLAELFAGVGMANETYSLASAWQVEVDEQFKA